MTPTDPAPPPGRPVDDAPLDPDDLAVLAVVDDEATAEQRRRVARDPGLVARVAALRSAIAAVAAPIAPPPEDVLGPVRRRAIASLGAPGADDVPGVGAPTAPHGEEGEPSDEGVGSPPSAPPVRDIGAARDRRSARNRGRRTLPPLPAVAAVVILLVVVGVGFLVAGTGGSDADQSASDDAATEATTVDDAEAAEGGGGAELEEGATSASGGGDAAAGEERPSDALRDELLGRAQATYASDDALVGELREVDLDTLALAGAPPSSSPDSEDAPATTTAGGGADASSTTAPTTPSARSLAADPVVTRCDDVLRSAEPDLEPVTAAALVAVDGVPVVVLSNATEVSEQAPSGVRLTVLNAVDCSPRAAVVR